MIDNPNEVKPTHKVRKGIRHIVWRVKEFIYDHNQFIERLLLVWKELFFWAEFIQPTWLRSLLLRTIQIAGDIVLILRDFPLIKFHILKTNRYQIVFVGQEVEEFKYLFFPEQEILQHDTYSLHCWKIPEKASEWFKVGTDLVVISVSKYFPWRLKTSYNASTPKWVSQAFNIPENCDEPPPGNKTRTLRKIYRENKGRINYRFSKDPVDFDLFYNQMYKPYISNRHGEFVYIESYEYLRKWFSKGGVIIVNFDGEPAAGMLVAINDDCLYIAESGILNGDPELHGAGFSRVSVWSSVQWAKSRGCEKVQLGGTYAFRSNGVYQFKTFWNSITEGFYGFIRNEWRIHLENPKDDLLDDLNHLGIIHENRDSYYAVVFQSNEYENLEEKLKETKEAIKDGLAGAAIISSGEKVYLKQTDLRSGNQVPDNVMKVSNDIETD